MSSVFALAIVLLQGAISASSDAMKVESRLALASYADCIVARKGDAVQFLLAKPYDDRVSKESRSLNDDVCPFATRTTTFDQRLVRKLDGLQLRSILYQALIRRYPGKVGISVLLPEATAFPVGRTWLGSPAMNYTGYIASGRCVIERDSGNARQLTLSPIASSTEAEAFKTLANTLGKCGWRGDEQLAARGALAEIYYRAAKAPGSE